MKISALNTRAYEFACRSAACRPPTSGGTGGSSKTREGKPDRSYQNDPAFKARIREITDATRKPSFESTIEARQAEAKAKLAKLAATKPPANMQEKMNRAMGIHKEPSLKQIAADRAKAGPMRDAVQTQGRAGSNPVEYRNNQMKIIDARNRYVASKKKK